MRAGAEDYKSFMLGVCPRDDLGEIGFKKVGEVSLTQAQKRRFKDQLMTSVSQAKIDPETWEIGLAGVGTYEVSWKHWLSIPDKDQK